MLVAVVTSRFCTKGIVLSRPESTKSMPAATARELQARSVLRSRCLLAGGQ